MAPSPADARLRYPHTWCVCVGRSNQPCVCVGRSKQPCVCVGRSNQPCVCGGRSNQWTLVASLYPALIDLQSTSKWTRCNKHDYFLMHTQREPCCPCNEWQWRRWSTLNPKTLHIIQGAYVTTSTTVHGNASHTPHAFPSSAPFIPIIFLQASALTL